jgi:hypothetical protein
MFYFSFLTKHFDLFILNQPLPRSPCWNWIGIYRMCAATSVGGSFDCICERGTASRNQTIAELKNCMSAPYLNAIKKKLKSHTQGRQITQRIQTNGAQRRPQPHLLDLGTSLLHETRSRYISFSPKNFEQNPELILRTSSTINLPTSRRHIKPYRRTKHVSEQPVCDKQLMGSPIAMRPTWTGLYL